MKVKSERRCTIAAREKSARYGYEHEKNRTDRENTSFTIMLRTHPFSIRFAPDGRDGDDHSELTGPRSFGDHWQDDDSLLGGMAADPYYYHNFGGIVPSSPEKRDMFDLKIQLARQQEKLESLSSKLRQCEVENESLEAEKAALVDELALAIEKQTPTKREERPTFESEINDNAGPIRLLVDYNAALTMENARLQAIVDVTRKSLKAHVQESRRRRDEDEKTIEALRLRREDELPLPPCDGRSACKGLRHSERTAKTSLMSSIAESAVDDSLRSIPLREVDFDPSGNGWIAEGEDIKPAYDARDTQRAPCARRKTVDCASSKDAERAFAAARDGSEGSRVVGSRRWPAWRGRKRIANNIAGSGAEDLLVGFSGARRSTARGWLNFDW